MNPSNEVRGYLVVADLGVGGAVIEDTGGPSRVLFTTSMCQLRHKGYCVCCHGY